MTDIEVKYMEMTIDDRLIESDIWLRAFQEYNRSLDEAGEIAFMNCKPCWKKVYEYCKTSLQ